MQKFLKQQRSLLVPGCCHKELPEVTIQQCLPSQVCRYHLGFDCIKTVASIRLSSLCQTFHQRCGSGSESGSGSTGSTCFWASRIRIRIHQSEVWIRIQILLWIRIRILLSACKNSKKNLDSYYFVTLFEFFSLKNDVNVASKSHKQKKLC